MSSRPAAGRASTAGFLAAFGAYFAWGLFPAYWKQVGAVPSTLVVAHRVVWSFAFVAVLLALFRRWPDFGRALREPRTRRALALSTVLISGNWLLFIWAINTGRVLQGSLGYYINPLVNVLLARAFLGERLRPAQWTAVALAAAGVVYLAWGVGTLPWVSLLLAGSFGVYGLVRKTASVEALTGLAVETALATPVAAGFLLWQAWTPGGAAVWGTSTREALFLLGAGVVTALPLWWFAEGARRLRYSTLGIIQYVAPTGQLLLAVLVYGELFTPRHAVTFACIWAAVALYTWDAWRASRPARPVAPVAPPAARGAAS